MYFLLIRSMITCLCL